MEITYRTNGVAATKSLVVWYFGKNFVETATTSAMRMHEKSGESEFKFWQGGTGYLTIKVC